ncbi:hypothetical protein V8G54_007968 [Vigna mungo]|uniref:Uncharacterized protein n=1 Tax=Vigna mungo TaxID=3915 RepID=A0AAQ3P4C7_VIGMU
MKDEFTNTITCTVIRRRSCKGPYGSTAIIKVKWLGYSIYFAPNYNVKKRVPQQHPMCIYSVGIRNRDQSTVHDAMIKHKAITIILGFQWDTLYELCTETAAQRTPGSCRNTDACLC